MQRLAAYGGAQGVVLVVNTISGFILVRGMGKEQYAWFTITNSLLATISVLSDSGLSSAMMSIGGRVCDDRSRFASLMMLAQGMRFRFMALAALVTLPAGWWMLGLNGAPWYIIVILLSLVIATSIPSVEGVVLGTINKLHRRVTFLIQADLCVSLSRLAMIVVGMVSGLSAVLASMATAGAQWIYVVLLRRQTQGDLTISDGVVENWRPEIHGVVRVVFPLSFFNCVQGHITTWLLSVFASTQDVADIGALMRLSVLFTFLGLPLSQLILPVISRSQEPRRLARLCLLALGGVTLAAVVLFAVAMAFSPQVLWVLGDSYAHLTSELMWFLGSQVLAVATTAAWGIAYTRSWVRHAWLQIPLSLALQALSAVWLDLSQVTQTILFASLSNITGLLIGVGLIFNGLKAHKTAMREKYSL